MGNRKRAIRPHQPLPSAAERELDEMTGGLLSRDDLKKAAADSHYIDGRLMLGVTAAHILIDHAPLSPAMKELRRLQFNETVAKIRKQPKENQ
jgi:hypothetical protein